MNLRLERIQKLATRRDRDPYVGRLEQAQRDLRVLHVLLE
jgi:hypothetical protein